LDLSFPFTAPQLRLANGDATPWRFVGAAALVLGGVFGTWLRVTLGGSARDAGDGTITGPHVKEIWNHGECMGIIMNHLAESKFQVSEILQFAQI
jgi:hypothetical protein